MVKAQVNLFPFLYTECVDVETLFYGDTSDILIIQDDDVGSYIPFYDINTLGNLCPGESYRIILSSDEVIEFEETLTFASNMVVGDGFNTFSLNDELSIPERFSLEEPYPNPFNPITMLNFAIPSEVHVSISVYNLQGRKIETLLSGNLEAGYHSVKWNADDHASGMYFVKMIAGDYMDTQKLMLIK